MQRLKGGLAWLALCIWGAGLLVSSVPAQVEGTASEARRFFS